MTAVADPFMDSMAASIIGEYQREAWRADPQSWVRDRLGAHLWSVQQRIVESVRDNRLTAVQSCHGIGKSWSCAACVVHRIDTHAPGRTRAVTTAPTGDQVKAVLWAEIHTIFDAASAHGTPPPGRLNEVDWKIDNRLIAFGRKPADHNVHGMQGIHAPEGVLVILDEACGIPAQIWTAALAIASDENSRILAVGNPDDPSSFFAQICKPGSGWNVIKVSAFDTPNFTGEPVPESVKGLTSRVYVEDVERQYGKESPIYISKVLGEFPDDAEDGVVSLSKLMGCTRERTVPWLPAQLLPVELGVDVGAGSGGDESVIQERRGAMVGRSWRSSAWDTVETTNHVLKAIKETGATSVKVDAIGIGQGVADSLRDKGQQGEHQARIVSIDVRKQAHNPQRFYNARSEMWWDVGRLLSEQLAWDLSGIPEDDRNRLITQLTAPKWKPDASGRIQVESKDDTKKRIRRSPDNADALLLAFMAPQGPSSFFDQLVASQSPQQQVPAMVQAIAAEQARGAA